MKNKLFYHVLFWAGIYLFWIFVLRNYSFSLAKTATVQFCYLFFITADYYIIVSLIIPTLLKKKKYVYFVLAIAGLITISALLRSLVSVQMNLYVFRGPKVPFINLYISSLVNIFIWVAIIVLGKTLIDRAYSNQQIAILEKDKAKHELDFLKAQINPHALFNSLNTIYGHIDKNNQTARKTLLKFSDLLRYQLYDCSEDKINLEKEIAYVKSYISFQQIRKEENLIVNATVNIGDYNYQIAPLLLVVLIENAFKFVSNFSDKDNKIDIEITANGTQFTFYISNTTDHRQALSAILAPGNGIGIVNLKRRLELLYPDKHEMALKQAADRYVATLILDLA
jgi:two-component system, LytTR family, sensor kinase